jgi:hypothetical protein
MFVDFLKGPLDLEKSGSASGCRHSSIDRAGNWRGAISPTTDIPARHDKERQPQTDADQYTPSSKPLLTLPNSAGEMSSIAGNWW